MNVCGMFKHHRKLILPLLLLLSFLLMNASLSFARSVSESEKEEFLKAVEKGDLQKVRMFVDQYPELIYADLEGKVSFIAAAEAGHKEIVEFFLSRGVDVNHYQKGSLHSTLLHCAASKGDVELVKFLLSKGAEVNRKNLCKRTPLHEASVGGYPAVVKLLVDNGAVVDAKADRDETPLHCAAWAGQAEVFEYLLSKGADPTLKFPPGESILNLAAFGGSIKIIRLLESRGIKFDPERDSSEILFDSIGFGKCRLMEYFISKGADIKFRKEGRYLIHAVILKSRNKVDANIIKMLISKGLDVNLKDSYGCVPLHYSTGCGLPEISNLLLEKGAKVNEKDSDGFTPLFGAVRQKEKNMFEIVKKLVEMGADVNLTGRWGSSVMAYAIAYGSPETVEYLLSRGAKFKTPIHLEPEQIAAFTGNVEVLDYYVKKNNSSGIKDNNGKTLLHYAVVEYLDPQIIYIGKNNYSDDVIKYLIVNGLNINSKDNDGKTPLHILVNSPRFHDGTNSLKLMLDSGADVNIRDKEGNTPVYYALGYEYEVVKLLIEAGADLNSRNNKGESPLYGLIYEYATDMNDNDNYEKSLKLLLSKGAIVGISELVLIFKNRYWKTIPVILLNSPASLAVTVIVIVVFTGGLVLLFRKKKKKRVEKNSAE